MSRGTSPCCDEPSRTCLMIDPPAQPDGRTPDADPRHAGAVRDGVRHRRRRGLREAWPAALAAGLVFGVVQFAVSNYVNFQLTDILASLASAAAVVGLTRIWSPGETAMAGGSRPAIAGGATDQPEFERRVRAEDGGPLGTREALEAFTPYVIIIIVLGIISLNSVTKELTKLTTKFSWPGLHILGATGKPPKSEIFKLDWLTAAGTGLLIAGVITVIVLRIRPGVAIRTYFVTLNRIKWALLTVCSVLALAYVMNFSGQTITLGTWAAGAGGFFAFSAFSAFSDALPPNKPERVIVSIRSTSVSRRTGFSERGVATGAGAVGAGVSSRIVRSSGG